MRSWPLALVVLLGCAKAQPPRPQVETWTSAGGWTRLDPEAVAASRDWVPLEVVVVDGETGAAMQLSATVAARPDDTAGLEWRSATHVRRGCPAFVEAKIVALSGYVAEDKGIYRGVAYVSRYATRVRLAAPLRREADIRVRVIDASGNPVGGARVRQILRAGPEPYVAPRDIAILEPTDRDYPEQWREESVIFQAAPTGQDGWTRVRGLPHLLDERLWIVAGDDERENFAGVALGAFGESYAPEIRLPATPSFVSRGISGASFSQSSFDSMRGPPTPFTPARLDVNVVRRDGTIATGVKVHLCGQKITDDKGRVVFEGLRPDVYHADVLDPDFVWSWRPIELHDGESRTLTITEPPGWTARATLLDSAGRRVPYARVEVHTYAPVEYVSVENGAQDLALYTDAKGEIELPRMHHTKATLTFRYGSREVCASLGERAPSAVVRLPPPR